MEAVPIKLARSDLEVQLTSEAEDKAGIEVDENEEFWIPVLSTFIQGHKINFVIALPWVPDEGDPEEDEDSWFLPTVIVDKDIYAMRFVSKKELN